MRLVMIATAALSLTAGDAGVAQHAAATGRIAHPAAARPAAVPDTYRRPIRGWALPVYWQAPRFAVADWRALGLREPLPGYRWMRYHGDAVLVDRNFSIFDVAVGVATRGADPFYVNDDRVYAGPTERRDVAPPALRVRPLPPPGPPLEPIDEAEDEPPIAPDRMPPPPGYADDDWVSPDGRTVVTTREDGPRWGGDVTTVTVGGAATTTTTVTITENYDAPIVRPRRLRSKAYRAPRI